MQEHHSVIHSLVPVCDTDRYSGWNIFFHCRINDQCGNRSDHCRVKHCGNLYGYLYDGCGGWMCCTDSNDFCYDYCFTGATFSYTGTPYCQNAANPSPTFSGGGVAGTFSSTVGLVFVSTSTGQINLSQVHLEPIQSPIRLQHQSDVQQ